MIRAALLALLALVAGSAAALDRGPPAQRTGPIAITGTGSTGDVSGMSVTPSVAAASGTLARLLYSPSFPGTVIAPYILGTGMGGLRATPPGGPNSYGLNVNMAPSGSVGNNYNPNGIVADTDTVDTGTGFFTPWVVIDQVGNAVSSSSPSVAAGGRQAILGQIIMKNPTASGSGNRNYSAVSGNFLAYTSDGGTDASSVGTSRGAGFALNGQAVLCGSAAVAGSCPGGTPAIGYLNLTAQENDVAAQAGSSVWFKSGIQVALMDLDAVQGTGYDGAFLVSGAGANSPGWKNAFTVVANKPYGKFPIATNGCVLCVYDGESNTIATGIDLTHIGTISGSSLALAGLSVEGGTGNVQMTNANAAIDLGSRSATGGTPVVNFYTGGSGNWSSRIIATGGGSASQTGTINYQASDHVFAGNAHFNNGVGFNGATVQGKCSLPAALPTDGTATNAALATAINSVRTCLINVGLAQ